MRIVNPTSRPVTLTLQHGGVLHLDPGESVDAREYLQTLVSASRGELRTEGPAQYGPDDDIPAGFYRIIGDLGEWADLEAGPAHVGRRLRGRAPFMSVDVYADGTRRGRLLNGHQRDAKVWSYEVGDIRLGFWLEREGWRLAPDRDRRPEFEKLMPDGVYRPEVLDVQD